MALCVVCKETIAAGAAYCTHCKHFQSCAIRLAIYVGTIVGVLVSVTSLALSARSLMELASDKGAEMTVFVNACDNQTVTLDAWNTGVGSAIFTDAKLSVSTGGKIDSRQDKVLYVSPPPDNRTLIEPTKHEQLTLSFFHAGVATPLTTQPDACSYHIVADFQDALGLKKSEVDCQCVQQ